MEKLKLNGAFYSNLVFSRIFIFYLNGNGVVHTKLANLQNTVDRKLHDTSN